MQISNASARRRPRATIAAGIAALLVLVGAGFAAADITGPDVSSHQHPYDASVDWSKVKDAGRNFAFVKSTEGTGYVNPYFNSDWNAIKANGMVRGSYHYAKPDGSPTSAAEQAPVTGAQAVHGAVLAHYLAIGGPSSALGLPTSDESPSADGAGRYNNFASGGALYWSPQAGAHEVHGAIDGKWGQLGWETGPHGYPMTDEQATADRAGRYNDFQDGSVYWSPKTGARSIHGAIKGKWAQSQWESGFLGYPVTDELSTPDGSGRYNEMQGGSIYWTPSTGAHSVQGVIKASWAAQGWERGTLGYPTSDEHSVPGGRQSDFQGGSLFWNSSTGAVSNR